ncbi:DNA polymerase III subunit epsilon [Buchnera aphidicola]|uniref:DNA polymerase III subunit epsilon n=1 Tax=Buchnera aphidicola TaxID=9 RepID=UPI00209220A8|nr:DNA polymerase III subunit epsilon [Buchnera aphidicola]USS94295.1 DNA polymerase III subunit epsilon [Buchnera aphidicola (Sipha maydis)]WII23845.1 DNA polymerase III subunit epsilon [Buchnera aphidicola (Sipha maydis)]
MNKYSRKIVLDTETTGMNSSGPIYLDHRIIEIGAIEIINRKITKNSFHVYLQPNRLIDKDAYKVHGISDQFLLDKPHFSEIYKNFIDYVKNSELIIHNAKFDLGFINYELSLLKKDICKIENYCSIIDTLKLSRKIFPGKKNNLDALCKRYKIHHDRKKHSAILDARLLANVYLLMTSLQKTFFFMDFKKEIFFSNKKKKNFIKKSYIQKNTNKENLLHIKYLKNMQKKSKCLWINKKI